MTVLVRETLHQQVWREPLGVLARKQGVSSAKLREACKKMSIPLPSLAHWRQIKAGGDLVVPALPPHDGEDHFKLGRKSKQSLAEWVLESTPAASHSPKVEKSLATPVLAQPGPRYLPLKIWAEKVFGEYPPHYNTLLQWIRDGRIQPQPKKIGRKYYVRPEADYREG